MAENLFSDGRPLISAELLLLLYECIEKPGQ
jgi:hypothetical protein